MMVHLSVAGICFSWLLVIQVVFHVAAAGLPENSHSQEEGREFPQSTKFSKYNKLLPSNTLTLTNNNTSTISKVKKSRVRKKQTPINKDVLVLNETPNKTLVYEIPVSNSKSSSSVVEDVSKSGSPPFKREIAKHPEQMKKKLEVRRKDKTIISQKKTSLMMKPNNNPSKSYEMKSPISVSVSDPRTLLLAPLLVAGPMMLAEAMTVGGMGLAVPGIIILPLLLIPLIIVSFIIFI